MNVELETGVRYHVRDQGQGAPTYLLLHGWAQSGAVWEPVLAQWPASSGRVLVPDLRGTGFSSKPRQGYGLNDYVSDVLALIDQLALEDLVLVGHSMGGTIAQRVALERSAILRSLVLVSPVPASGVPFDDAQVAYFRSLGGSREGAEQVIGSMIAKPLLPEQLERLIKDVATVSLDAYLGAFDAWRTAAFADRLGALRMPTLVLAGGAEQPLTPELLQSQVVDRIPGSRLVVLPGVGHYPQVECTDLLVQHLIDAARQA